MRNLFPLLTTFAIISVAIGHAGAYSEEVSFSQQIQPILTRNCFACHGPDAEQRKAELRLDVEESATEHAIVPGHADESDVIIRIQASDPDVQMPPPDFGKSLTPAEIELLRRWIDAGAKWSGHWAFESVTRPTVPDSGGDWPRNEIDQFIHRKMVDADLSSSPEADRRILVRRLYLDVIGLPPTPEQLKRFLSDNSDRAYEVLVDELLMSEHYGERMAVPWLDGARYADTNGFQNDFYRVQWPWRDWVIKAFNNNMPYDQFLIEQIAGDLLSDATDEQRIATGFNRNNHSVTEGGSIEEEWFVENVIDRVSTTSTVFLGLTMGCARCHSHKYDPITQKDFYRFYAYFGNVDERGVYQEARGNVGPQVSLATEEQLKGLQEFEERLREIKKRAEETGTKLRAERDAVRNERSRYDQSAVPRVMVMKDRTEMRPAFLLRRGQYDSPDKSEELWPDVPAFLPEMSADLPRNRLGLAHWMVSPENPLVARVIVNRFWSEFFGRGIVASIDNFGIQSSPPSHPELLDWLAADLMENGWNLKRLQKKILMSSTYRQSSARRASDVGDEGNKYLARASRFRLPAETLRDNALAISGLLQHRIGGPSARPYQPDGLWMELAGGANDGPYKMDGVDGLYRKSLYTYRKRTVSHPTLSTFDAPNWETCWIDRATTNTPLQALALLNDTTYVEAGSKLAERMMREVHGDAEQRIAWAWTLATCREPDESRTHLMAQAFERYRNHFQTNPDSAVEYLASGVSELDQSLNSVELAAYSLVAATILNLDEVITRE